ncbi:MAG: hypothetical protein FD174_3770 [Geobacteraceae bacterium]|nr:MAG: hypothetical protein FD174_3770 [Geobacteraceae bacterium]
MDIWLAFLAGLAGSPHCLGMCGGIVAAIAMADRDGTLRTRQLFQLFYNLGRISTYGALGIAAGFVGSSLDIIAMRSAALWIMAGANLFVLVIGLASALRFSPFTLFALEGSGGKYFSCALRWTLSGVSPLRAYPLGVVFGFLPCGLVYGPLITTVGSGGPLQGGMIMAALGLGTLPLLLIFGSASTALSGRIGGNYLRITGLLVAVMGFVALWRVLGKIGVVPRFPM